LDVLATICDLAAIDAPKTSEGISFEPVLRGKQEAIRDVMYGAYCGGAKPGMRCVKKGDWKLIQYGSPRDGVRETQLFNLADNPHEYLQEHEDPKVAKLIGARPTKNQRNLAEDPRYLDKLADMESLLLAEMRRLDDPYRLWSQPDDGLVPPVTRSQTGARQSNRKQKSNGGRNE
jgi:choline-sulfatase